MLIGYARVSSTGQSLDVQHEQLKAAGCDKIYSEKRSGRSGTERPELGKALDQMRTGDTFIVTRLDRLARSVGDLQRLVERMTLEGVAFQCVQQGGVDTSTSTGKLMLGILGAVAEFENDIRRERQRDGIEKAKQEGRYNGRPVSVDVTAVRKLKEDGLGAAAIARELRIGRASVYRALSLA